MAVPVRQQVRRVVLRMQAQECACKLETLTSFAPNRHTLRLPSASNRSLQTRWQVQYQ